jgi:copper(I)-binding protein
MKIVGNLFMLSAALFIAAPAFADGNDLKVDQAWARATPGNAKTAAVYLTITNNGTAPDTLESASTPAADKAELHDTKMENNVMEMRPVGPLTIAPGKSVVLAPSGYHLMLTGLKAPLKEGQTVPVTLIFDHAGAQQVTASIAKVGAMGPNDASKPGGDAMSGMDMSTMPGMH